MNRNATRLGSARSGLLVGALALALTACSSGGGGGEDPVVPASDDPAAATGGSGGLVGPNASGASADGGIVGDGSPFTTAATAPRPDAALPTSDGTGPTAGPGTSPGTGFGAGPDDAPAAADPFVGGASAQQVEDVTVPVSNPFTNGRPVATEEAVLPQVQNGFVDENDFDLWVCEAPDAADLTALGYLFIDDEGATIVVPADGSDVLTYQFDTTEPTAGSLLNVYADAGLSETMDAFRFDGPDAFAATSDAFGEVGCERFVIDEEGGTTGGTAVSDLVQNTLDVDGDLENAWVCQGPQSESDALVYVFIDGEGLFLPVTDGVDTDPLTFAYAENAPGTLDLTYEAGAVESLTGIAFDGDTMFDMTSSYDGPLSCELVDL